MVNVVVQREASRLGNRKNHRNLKNQRNPRIRGENQIEVAGRRISLEALVEIGDVRSLMVCMAVFLCVTVRKQPLLLSAAIHNGGVIIKILSVLRTAKSVISMTWRVRKLVVA